MSRRNGPRPTEVTVISDIVDHYGFPQMLLAPINGYRRYAGENTPPMRIGFASVPSFGVEPASRLAAVLARRETSRGGKGDSTQIITIVADPGVAQHGYILELKNNTTVVTPGNPKGVAASQIIHEAGGRDAIKRVVMLDHSSEKALANTAKYKYGWPTFPGLGLYSHVAGLLAAGVDASKLGKTLNSAEQASLPLLEPEKRKPTEAEHTPSLKELKNHTLEPISKDSRLFVLLNFMPEGQHTPHPEVPVPEGYYVPMYVNSPGLGTAEEPVVSHSIARHLGEKDAMAIAGPGTVRIHRFLKGPTVIEGQAEDGSRLHRLARSLGLTAEGSFKSTEQFSRVLPPLLRAIATRRKLTSVPDVIPTEPHFRTPRVIAKDGTISAKIIKQDSFGNVTTNIYPEHLRALGIDSQRVPKEGVPLVLEYEGKHPDGGILRHLFRIDLMPKLSAAKGEGHTVACPAGGDDGALTFYTFMGHAAGTIGELTRSENVVGRSVRLHRFEDVVPHLKAIQGQESRRHLTLGGAKVPHSRLKVHEPLPG